MEDIIDTTSSGSDEHRNSISGGRAAEKSRGARYQESAQTCTQTGRDSYIDALISYANTWTYVPVDHVINEHDAISQHSSYRIKDQDCLILQNISEIPVLPICQIQEFLAQIEYQHCTQKVIVESEDAPYRL